MLNLELAIRDHELINRLYSNYVEVQHPHMNTPCWEYQGYRKENGYCQIRWTTDRPHNIYVHRLSFAYAKGESTNLLVCHKCDNTNCINPDHLFEGTQQDNLQDSLEKDRFTTGERHGRATFSWYIIFWIRKHYRKTIDDKKVTQMRIVHRLPQRFGVTISQAQVSSILRNEAWVDRNWCAETYAYKGTPYDWVEDWGPYN